MNRRLFILMGGMLTLSGCTRMKNAWKLGFNYGNVCDENGDCDIVDIYADQASLIDVFHVSRIRAEKKYADAVDDGLLPREGALFSLTINEAYQFSDILMTDEIKIINTDIDVEDIKGVICKESDKDQKSCYWDSSFYTEIRRLVNYINDTQNNS